MDRPVTSKPRGTCRYYNTPRGCYAGDDCKFLHGPEEKLTPYDKSKVCRYYVQGHCTRGERCWFRHELQNVPLDDELKHFDENVCAVCLEKPKSYGLLSGCSHVFCLQCIRQWREPQGKSTDMVISGILKRCPMCRVPSRFISPSTHFFPEGHPRKQLVIDSYRNSMARVPCRYFVDTSASGRPCCPFGSDCFYQHLNADGTPHIFQYGADHFMKVFRRQQLRHRRGFSGGISDTELADQLRILQSIIEDPTNSLHVAINFVRQHLPAIWNSMDEASGTAIETPEDDGVYEDNEDHQAPELLDEGVAAERLSEAISLQIPPVADTSNAGEGSSRLPVQSPMSVPAIFLPPRARSVSSDTELLTTSPMHFRSSSSVDVSVPLPHSFMPWAMPRTPSPRPSSVSPTPMTPSVQPSNSTRFSTVLNSHGRETMIIDISDEEDEEDETDEDLSPLPNIGNDDHDNDNDNGVSSTSVVIAPPELASSPGPSGPAETLAGNTDEQTAPSSRPQCEHDKDPPFVTDGRGRVVWSRTARGSQVQAQAQVERERRRSSPAIKVRGQTSETGVSQAAVDGRGCVVSIGQEVGRIGDAGLETETETDAER